MKWNPPADIGEWRGLSEEEKWKWLQCVRDSFFERTRDGDSRPPKRCGRTVVIDGEWMEDAPSFFCMVGEAVDGPGGYFGDNMMAFDDALCGGFGLDPPSILRWVNSAKSKVVLDGAALARSLRRDAEGQRAQTYDERRHNYDPFLVYNRGRPAYLELLRLAESGERTLFEEIVSMIEFRSTQTDIRLLLE